MMEIDADISVQIGALGEFIFEPGIYYYGGSAKRGLAARVRRHYRHNKKIHWHIDYLTVHLGVHLKEAWLFPGFSDVEHELSDNTQVSLQNLPRGFGNGDCTMGCPSHLWRGSGEVGPEHFSDEYYTESFLQKNISE